MTEHLSGRLVGRTYFSIFNLSYSFETLWETPFSTKTKSKRWPNCLLIAEYATVSYSTIETKPSYVRACSHYLRASKLCLHCHFVSCPTSFRMGSLTSCATKNLWETDTLHPKYGVVKTFTSLQRNARSTPSFVLNTTIYLLTWQLACSV